MIDICVITNQKPWIFLEDKSQEKKISPTQG